MKPIHVVMNFVGVKNIVLGSTNHGGREAAEQLVSHVLEGASTVVLPDGPYGPSKILKKGVLFMALETKAPILPLTFHPQNYIQGSGWDQKWFLLPFQKMKVRIHSPIYVTDSNFIEVAQKLTETLNWRK